MIKKLLLYIYIKKQCICYMLLVLNCIFWRSYSVMLCPEFYSMSIKQIKSICTRNKKEKRLGCLSSILSSYQSKIKIKFSDNAHVDILYMSFQHLHLFFYLCGKFNDHFNSKLGFASFILQYVWISTYITVSN